MKFHNVPAGGVKKTTPDGHYLDMRGDLGQIITVGAHLSHREYSDAIEGYAVTSIGTMPHDDGAEPDPRFTSIMLKAV